MLHRNYDPQGSLTMLSAIDCEARGNCKEPCAPHQLSLLKLSKLKIAPDRCDWLLPGRILDIKVAGDMFVVMVEKDPEAQSIMPELSCKRTIKRDPREEKTLVFYKLVKEMLYILFELPARFDTRTFASTQWAINESSLILIKDKRSITEVPLYWASRRRSTTYTTAFDCSTDGLALGSYGDFYVIKRTELHRYTNVPFYRTINLQLKRYHYSDGEEEDENSSSE